VELMTLLVKAGAVFGLLALTVRMLRRLDGGRRGARKGGRLATLAGGKGRRSTTMEIVERKPLGRASSVVLLRVRDQHWVVGVTEQQVQVLLEVDVEDAETDVVDVRGQRAGAAGNARAGATQPGWADLGRMVKERLPFRPRTTSTTLELDALGGGDDLEEVVAVDELDELLDTYEPARFDVEVEAG